MKIEIWELIKKKGIIIFLVILCITISSFVIIYIIIINNNGTTKNHCETYELRELADSNGINLGTGLNHHLSYNLKYLPTLSNTFNTIVTGWESIWESIHPERDTYNFKNVDSSIKIAESYNMKIIWRGDLLWYIANPNWLANIPPYEGTIHQRTSFSRAELISILEDHISKVIGRYQNNLDEIYVANEVINTNWSETQGWYIGQKGNLWYDSLGPDYLELALNYTHGVAPNAKLFINNGFHWWDTYPDIREQQGEIFYNLIKDLLEKGCPLDGVGIQFHLPEIEVNPWIPDQQNFTEMEGYIKSFNDLGLEVHLSEVSRAILKPVTNEKLQLQAEIYQKVLEWVLKYDHVTTMIIWGISDFSGEWWLSETQAAPVLFDYNFCPKPAYYALKHRLSGETTTYVHDFDNPKINPPKESPLHTVFGIEESTKLDYQILIANYDNLNKWPLISQSSNDIIGELEAVQTFSVKINSLPDYIDYANIWKDQNVIGITISGKAFYWDMNADYRYITHYLARPTFVQDVLGFDSLYWVRDIATDDTYWEWNDLSESYKAHGWYHFGDSNLEIIEDKETWGFIAQNEVNMTHAIWNKDTGVLMSFHYNGIYPESNNISFEFKIQLI